MGGMACADVLVRSCVVRADIGCWLYLVIYITYLSEQHICLLNMHLSIIYFVCGVLNITLDSYTRRVLFLGKSLKREYKCLFS